jgi:hypothetical protein
MYDQFVTRDRLYDLYENSSEFSKINADDVFILQKNINAIVVEEIDRILSSILALYCNESFRTRIQTIHENYRNSFHGNGLKNAMKVINETVNFLKLEKFTD